LDGKPDLVIAGGKGKEIASTIVSFRFSPPKILRSGAVSEERIRKLYE
jgi:tRNA A37 threonylcarbamoyladenosine synthetase subunit TsaC/SUA5/YrdC